MADPDTTGSGGVGDGAVEIGSERPAVAMVAGTCAADEQRHRNLTEEDGRSWACRGGRHRRWRPPRVRGEPGVRTGSGEGLGTSLDVLPGLLGDRAGGGVEPAALVDHRVLLVERAVLHDRVDLVVVLQDGDVGERVAVDENEVGEEAGLDLAEVVGPEHDLAAELGGREDGLHRREPEPLDEVLEVAGVRPVRGPGEAVVAAREQLDAPLVHLAKALDGLLELLLVADGLGGLLREPEGLGPRRGWR